MKICLVEDNRMLARSLIKGLRANRHQVEHFFRGDDAKNFLFLHHSSIDVIILDRMLPGMSGDELCQALRANNIETPILMLTAKSATDDTVEGLLMGADDYLKKPFEFSELLARLHALSRRKPHIEKDIFFITKNTFLDFQKREVIQNGQEVHLSPKEFSVLEVLAKNAGIALSRDEIFERVCDFASDNWSNTIDVHIKNIRKKLFSGSDEDPIKTVRGIGYRLEPQK